MSNPQHQGPDSISRCRLTSIGNPMLEIRWSYDRLIYKMGFPILVRRHLYIESGPRLWYSKLALQNIVNTPGDCFVTPARQCWLLYWYEVLNVSRTLITQVYFIFIQPWSRTWHPHQMTSCWTSQACQTVCGKRWGWETVYGWISAWHNNFYPNFHKRNSKA